MGHVKICGSSTHYGLQTFFKGYSLYKEHATSSNGNSFHAKGPLRREFTGHRWIPIRRQWCWALMFSLICAWTSGWANTWDASDLIPLHSLWHHCNGNGYLQHWMARVSLNDIFQGIFQKKKHGHWIDCPIYNHITIDFFFTKSSQGDFSATPIGTPMSWVTCFIYIENETGTSYIGAKGLVGPAKFVWGPFCNRCPVTNH